MFGHMLTGHSQYCEFGGTVRKCEEWLEQNHPEMHAKLYSQGKASNR
jgi:hypothetical protein